VNLAEERSATEWTWDDAEITLLVARHQRGVAAYLGSLGCDGASVDDLVQETFLTLLSARFEPRSTAASAAFLRRIARNLFLKSLRRAGREIPDLSAVETAWIALDEDSDAGESYLAAVRRCLAALSDRAREVLALRYRDGLDGAAIAERLALSLGGVKSILLRAKASLRGCIERTVRA
jgi:RNA polymerase sigma-70 factor (ECF subfamily)